MPQTPSSPPQLRLENQICFAVHSAAHAFAQAYKPHLEPLGLTYPQYLVMLLLWEKDDRSVSELGAPLFLDSGTLTPLLKRLQTAGLISRKRDDKDERVTRITLTEAGSALRIRAETVPAAMLCAMGSDVEELMSLKAKIANLGQSLRAA
jgi:MarR family transcriptional regulator, organic hydroperoxide resistance regulator